MSTKFMATVAALLLVGTALSACGGVTETGNPCQQSQCYYNNDRFGVRVGYPQGWSTTEDYVEELAEPVPGREGATSDSVSFSGSDGQTYVTIIFTSLISEPDSLEAYLAEQYPDTPFEAYDTSTLSGFVYDDPAEGGNGGDLREYFFLGGAVLVHVGAEVFPAGEAEFSQLLEWISFQ